MIEAKNLTKKYGTHTAVRNLSFKAEKGKVLGFLGPNGAGKTTTMNMLTGYISATEGTVLVNGIDMYEAPEEAKRSIGYLPELPPVYPDMTVREYLRFVAELRSVKKSETEAMLADVMKRTNTTDVAGRLIKHLSKGYKQRVGLAGALIGYPDVLILDEPTVGLDPKQIIEIRDLIRSLSRDHAIILSSHILSEISEICDEIMIINKGKLVAVGTPAELTARMKGGSGIIIEVPAGDAAEKRVAAVCGSVAGVVKIIPKGAEGNGTLTFEIVTDGKRDIRSDLFFAFAGEKLPLLKIDTQVRSLEDIFLEMTGGKGEQK